MNLLVDEHLDSKGDSNNALLSTLYSSIVALIDSD
jgi:hypothetical protein